MQQASSLVRIPSVTGNEREVSEHVSRTMKKIGMEVTVDDAGGGRRNVIGRIRGAENSPVLILNGHMDVVPPGDLSRWTVPPFEGVVRDGRLYGRGAADMKGGLASVLTAVRDVVHSGVRLRGDLVVEAVVDEEAGGRAGTGRLTIDNPVKGNFVLIAEPTNLEVQLAHKGDLGVEILVEGRSAHAATPEMGVNAVHKMIPLAERILGIPRRYGWEKRHHPLLGPPHITISVLDGGIQRNIIPDRCRMIVDRRILPGLENLETARREIEQVISEARAEDKELRVFYHSILEIEGMETGQDEPVARALVDASSEVTGSRPKISGLRGFCDAHYYTKHLGIPVVIFGPGSLEQAHTVDEYVEIRQLRVAAEVYRGFILKLLI